MKKLDNIVEIKTPEMKLEIDPRSMTTANKAARNEIAVGEEVEVRGSKRMLKSKSKKATWI